MRSTWKCKNVRWERRNRVLYFRATIVTDWKKSTFLSISVFMYLSILDRHAWLCWRTNARGLKHSARIFCRDLCILWLFILRRRKKWFLLRLETNVLVFELCCISPCLEYTRRNKKLCTCGLSLIHKRIGDVPVLKCPGNEVFEVSALRSIA